MKLAIVGAGLLGRLIVWRLSKQDSTPHSVSLFDTDFSGANSAARVAAAMLAPLSELVGCEPVVANKGKLSIQLWQQWSQELLQHGIDISFKQTGSLVVAHANDEGDFQLFLNSLQGELPKTDFSIDDVALLNREAIAEIEPALHSAFDKACYLKPEGSIDNVALLDGLMQHLEALSAEGENSSGMKLNCIEQALPDVLPREFLAKYDQVIDCRGFSAKQQWAEINHQLSTQTESEKSLRGVRGEVIRVKAPEVFLSRPIRLMHPRYQLYIAPKPNHEFVIGATQIESESEHAITTRSSLELLSALYSIDTGFAESQVLETHARCRPAFMDNLPAIIHHENLLCVNGLYRHGYLLAPVVVEQVLQCLCFNEQSDDNVNAWPEIVVRHSEQKVQEEYVRQPD